MSDVFRAVSYLAPNWFGCYEAISQSFSRALDTPIQLTQSALDALDDPAFRNNEVDIAFVCGLPYTRWHRVRPTQFTILGAPVMQAARYQDRPIYFADVIVKANSNLHEFGDLRGKTLCYNDSGSNSGYNILRAWMIDAGLTDGFFGNTIASGSHQRSIEWVLEGRADGSAIDSTVLEQTVRDRPELSSAIRVCRSVGPSPIPPILAATRLGSATIAQMQAALLNPDAPLAEAMARAAIRRFALMQPEAYDILGHLWDKAIAAGFDTIR